MVAPVPMARAGVDTSRDGRPNLIVTGVDLNRDGIPDVLQQALRVGARTEPLGFCSLVGGSEKDDLRMKQMTIWCHVGQPFCV